MKRILIIDDDEGIRTVLKLVFERAGYEVMLSDDGKFILSENYLLPDIFLLDRYLSGTDGLDLCRHLKTTAYSKDVPVIMISASPDLATTALKAGADGFIEKPFNVKDLLAIIDKHIAVELHH